MNRDKFYFISTIWNLNCTHFILALISFQRWKMLYWLCIMVMLCIQPVCRARVYWEGQLCLQYKRWKIQYKVSGSFFHWINSVFIFFWKVFPKIYVEYYLVVPMLFNFVYNIINVQSLYFSYFNKDKQMWPPITQPLLKYWTCTYMAPEELISESCEMKPLQFSIGKV